MKRFVASSFVLRRMGSARMLLGSILLAVLVASAMAGALVTFNARALPTAAHHQLVTLPGMSVDISGQFDAAQAGSDAGAIRRAMRSAFGAVPVTMDGSPWDQSLALAGQKNGIITRLMAAAAPDRIRAHAALVTGTWPGLPRRGQPIPAAIPATSASELGLKAGDILALHDLTGAAIRMRLTGVYRPLLPRSLYWGLSLVGTSGRYLQGNFATYGPMIVSPAAFGPGGLSVTEASWVVVPDVRRLSEGDLAGQASRIDRAATYLGSSATLGGLLVTSPMPGTLRAIATSLVVARSVLLIGALQLLLLTTASVMLAGRLLANQREEETALLSARGLARRQLAFPAMAEAALLAAVPAAAGALLGSRLADAAVAAGSGPAAAGGAFPVAVWWSAAGIFALWVFLALLPVLRPGQPGSARRRRGRQPSLAGTARAGADLALIAIAALAVWQLHIYSAASRGVSGRLGVDPVLALAPTLALAGVALIPLRILPVLARGLDSVTARTTRITAALASWQVSRRPVRQSGPALLMVLAVATGTMALSQHQSWRRSALDQAAFAAGADVRVNLAAPVPLGKVAAIADARGVVSAMPVTRLSYSGGGDVLAIGTARAAATALLRPDLSPLPAAALWRRIAEPGPAPGLVLPGRPARLQIAASMSPVPAARQLGPMSASVTIRDAEGIVYSVPAGVLTAGPHALVARLSPTPGASYPLRLLALSLVYSVPVTNTGHRITVTVRSLAAAAADGPFPAPFAQVSTLRRWQPRVSSAQLEASGAAALQPVGAVGRPILIGSGAAASGGPAMAMSFTPGYGELVAGPRPAPPLRVTAALTLTAPLPAGPIPAIATRAFLSSNKLPVGSVVSITAGADEVGASIVSVVSAFPTVNGAQGGGLIVDLQALQDQLVSDGADPVPVTEWWLSTPTAAIPRGLPPGSVLTQRARLAAALLTNPLTDAPQLALLAVAAAASVLAALGFSVSVAASARERRSQSALLAALGVARWAQARQLCLEQLMLSLPAAISGLLLGAGLARLIVPSVTLTAAASAPVPPVLVEFPLGWTAALALAVTAVPVLVAAATVAYRPDPAAQLRAAEAT